MLLELVRVGVQVEDLALGILDAREDLGVVELAVLDEADIEPVLVVFGVERAGAGEPVDAAIDGVAFAFPGGHQSAGLGMHFVDAAVEAVHLSVDAGGKSGDPRANDDDAFGVGLFGHGPSHVMIYIVYERGGKWWQI